jgi:predicted alpha/beta hydrolase family esterase
MNHDNDLVLAAHSLGCLLTAELARQAPAQALVKIKGTLLVAPPDPEGEAFPQSAQGFYPAVATPLAFPSMVIASDNDAYGSIAYAQRCTAQWGSTFIDIGPRGHINSESGLGLWPQGWAWLEHWL